MAFFEFFPTTYFNGRKIKNVTKRIRVRPEVQDQIGFYEQYLVKDHETPHVLAERFYDNPELHWVILLLNNLEDGRADWVMPQRVFEEYINEKYSAQTLLYDDIVLFQAGDLITNGNVTSEVLYVDQYERKMNIRGNVADYLIGQTISSVNDPTLSANVTQSVLESESPHHYIIKLPNEDLIVNRDTSMIYLDKVYNSFPVTVREYETEVNEKKRVIRILKKEFLGDFVREFQEKMKRG